MSFVVLQNIFWFLIMIGVMILIHELGHYWAARFFDVKVDTFSFGFGPRLFGFKKGETDFRFSAILLGGYVKMVGEQPGDEHATDPRSFLNKPRWQRLIILFAGPAMNVILAVAVLTGLFMIRFPKVPSNAVARDWLRGAQQRRSQSRFRGRRPHRTNRRYFQPHLGRHQPERGGQRGPSAKRLGCSQRRAQAVHGDAGAGSENGRRIRRLGRAEPD